MTELIDIIDILKAVPTTTVLGGERKNFLIANAARRGYIFAENALTHEAELWLNARVEPNETFYKNWSDIVSKSRAELAIDQILHYASTYGTNYEGEPYIPNDHMAPFIPFEKFTYIPAITIKEAYDKCVGMLQTSIALNTTTQHSVLQFIEYAIENYGYKLDIDTIKNKEAQAALCIYLRITPSDKFSLLRYMVYRSTNAPEIIQNSEIIRRIAAGWFDMGELSNQQLHSLASIFYRYKNIFLAFRKQSKVNACVVNKIRRYAVRDHKPFVAGAMQTILNSPNDTKIDVKMLKGCSSYELVRLYQAAVDRECIQDGDYKQYIIRNGKMYIKPAKEVNNKDFLTSLEMIIYGILINRMRGGRKVFIFPNNINIAAPTSEKNFVGAFPLGTHVDLATNNYIGIYWRGEDGADDFDLHYCDVTGIRYGWNAAYAGGGIIFSGDMTSADPSASEVFYTRGNFKSGVFDVCRFNGAPGSKYQLFIAQNDDIHTDLKRGFMVNPNDIITTIPMVSDISNQKVGIVANNKFFFIDNASSNSIVPRATGAVPTGALTKIMERKLAGVIRLQDLLRDAGHIVITEKQYRENYEIAEGYEIVDLSNPSKEQIIQLFNNK